MNAKLMQMSMLLNSIDNEEAAFACLRTEHKDTLEKLHFELRKLRDEVITGQQTFPIDEPPPGKVA